MSKIVLTHLAFVGASRPTAVVEFGDGLTIIYGASDTGKSYIVEAIDFMLGASGLREIPQISDYSHVLLGMYFEDGYQCTLARSPRGGRFSLFNGYLRDVPRGEPERYLSPIHGKNGTNNISSFLLEKIGLSGFRVRKNQRNDTRELSIRDVAHVCLVGETRMQAERSPVLATGQYVSATAEKSVFRVLLTGDDDSALISASDSSEKRRVSRGKIDLLDSVIVELASQVSQLGTSEGLRGRLESLNAAIEDHSSSIGESTRIRDNMVEQRRKESERHSATWDRISEVNDLLSRFGLLREKYVSDLARLDMVREAGTLLGYFNQGVCVFCGANPENQRHAPHGPREATMLAEAVHVEQEKTSTLLADLLLTISDLEDQHRELQHTQAGSSDVLDGLAARIAELDALMRPVADSLAELLDSRSEVERGIAVFDQIAKLEARRASLQEEGNKGESVAPSSLDVRTIREFTDGVKKVLDNWGIPESERVTFDLNQSDLLVGDQLRSSRGKGMRAILHAAFTVSLAKYCLERNVSHPGLIALDSPVVTFRDPEKDRDVNPVTDEPMSETVADKLYRQLGNDFDGQAIVVENVTPPDYLSESVAMVHFTGSRKAGRFGLFPL